MKKKIKIICFDLDNTICVTKKNYYNLSKPKVKIVKLINNLYENGYIIKIFTARYMGRSKENPILARKKGYNLTKNQLKKWNIKYHKLIMGKPSYDLYIDDKNIDYNSDWPKILTRRYIKN